MLRLHQSSILRQTPIHSIYVISSKENVHTVYIGIAGMAIDPPASLKLVRRLLCAGRAISKTRRFFKVMLIG